MVIKRVMGFILEFPQKYNPIFYSDYIVESGCDTVTTSEYLRIYLSVSL